MFRGARPPEGSCLRYKLLLDSLFADRLFWSSINGMVVSGKSEAVVSRYLPNLWVWELIMSHIPKTDKAPSTEALLGDLLSFPCYSYITHGLTVTCS